MCKFLVYFQQKDKGELFKLNYNYEIVEFTWRNKRIKRALSLCGKQTFN